MVAVELPIRQGVGGFVVNMSGVARPLAYTEQVALATTEMIHHHRLPNQQANQLTSNNLLDPSLIINLDRSNGESLVAVVTIIDDIMLTTNTSRMVAVNKYPAAILVPRSSMI